VAAEVWIKLTFDFTKNAGATNLSEVIWLHWELYRFRYLTLAVISLVQSLVVYIVDTGMVRRPATTEERIRRSVQISEAVSAKVKISRLLCEVIMKRKEWSMSAEKWWAGRERDAADIPMEVKLQWERDAQKWIDEIIQIRE
jgi:hypothetical protein